MDRPRIAAIVSGAAASTAAFTVVSHWQLLGTLAGAALVPIIYTVVSHWSSAGLDEAGKWLRSRLARGSSRKGDDPVEEDATAGEGSSLAEGSRESAGRGRKTQWLLVGPAFAALVLSVYTLASPPVEETVETVVVERVIVEKTVTVTTEPAGTLLVADDGESADPTSGPASGAVSSPGSSTIASDVKTEGGSETTDDTEVAEGSEGTGDTSAGTEGDQAGIPEGSESGVHEENAGGTSPATSVPVLDEGSTVQMVAMVTPAEMGQESGSATAPTAVSTSVALPAGPSATPEE
ncbi:MAG: hypothetical protein GXY46_05425 [Actinobacteria bacterium]|nr:hypothetical protein [Actinomycetota bacterium]